MVWSHWDCGLVCYSSKMSLCLWCTSSVKEHGPELHLSSLESLLDTSHRRASHRLQHGFAQRRRKREEHRLVVFHSHFCLNYVMNNRYINQIAVTDISNNWSLWHWTFTTCPRFLKYCKETGWSRGAPWSGSLSQRCVCFRILGPQQFTFNKGPLKIASDDDDERHHLGLTIDLGMNESRLSCLFRPLSALIPVNSLF